MTEFDVEKFHVEKIRKEFQQLSSADAIHAFQIKCLHHYPQHTQFIQDCAMNALYDCVDRNKFGYKHPTNEDDYIVFNKDNYINKLDAGENMDEHTDKEDEFLRKFDAGEDIFDIHSEYLDLDSASRNTESVIKRFLILLEKVENSNKWIVEDGSDNTFEVINETNDNDYTEGSIIAVRLRTEQTYLIEKKKLYAKYFVEEVLATYKSVFEIESEMN